MNPSTRRLPVFLAATGVLAIAVLACEPLQAQPAADPALTPPPPGPVTLDSSNAAIQLGRQAQGMRNYLSTSFEQDLATDAIATILRLEGNYEALYAAGKAYRESPEYDPTSQLSTLVISDVDIGDIRQVFRGYREARNEPMLTEALANVRKLAAETIEIVSRSGRGGGRGMRGGRIGGFGGQPSASPPAGVASATAIPATLSTHNQLESIGRATLRNLSQASFKRDLDTNGLVAVRNLQIWLDTLYEAGVVYRQSRDNHPSALQNHLVISDTDMNDIRRVLRAYLDAKDEAQLASAKADVNKLIAEAKDKLNLAFGLVVDNPFEVVAQPNRPTAVTVQGRRIEEMSIDPVEAIALENSQLNRFFAAANQPNPAIGRIQDQIRRATEALRNAETDEQKAQAIMSLKDTLNEYFEADLKRRAEELAQIEDRVKKLREQLELRRDKKQEIIDLQIKVAENEADGLGFFGVPAEPQTGQSPVVRSLQANQRAIVEERIERARPADTPQEVRLQDRRRPNPQPARPPQAGTLNDLFGPAGPNQPNPPVSAEPPR